MIHVPRPRLTDTAARSLREAQAACDRTREEVKIVERERNDLLRKYFAEDVGVTEMAREIGVSRSQVNRIIHGGEN